MCFVKYDVFCSHIFRYAYSGSKASVSKKFEIMEKLCTLKTFSKMADGGCIPLILSASGHQLQIPSKESGIFQSLGTINFVSFY